jgi:hypothetical protein
MCLRVAEPVSLWTFRRALRVARGLLVTTKNRNQRAKYLLWLRELRNYCIQYSGGR